MTKDERALKAAETIREYCKSITADCEGCIFDRRDPHGIWIGAGCLLHDPDHLPETWELEKIKNGGNMTREEAIKTLKENSCALCAYGSQNMESCDIRGCDNRDAIKALEQEPLTDKEQRIFLAAMGREEKICREVDEKNPYKEPYEDSLMSVCRSIERKVKKALWE